MLNLTDFFEGSGMLTRKITHEMTFLVTQMVGPPRSEGCRSLEVELMSGNAIGSLIHVVAEIG